MSNKKLFFFIYKNIIVVGWVGTIFNSYGRRKTLVKYFTFYLINFKQKYIKYNFISTSTSLTF